MPHSSAALLLLPCLLLACGDSGAGTASATGSTGAGATTTGTGTDATGGSTASDVPTTGASTGAGTGTGAVSTSTGVVDPTTGAVDRTTSSTGDASTTDATTSGSTSTASSSSSGGPDTTTNGGEPPPAPTMPAGCQGACECCEPWPISWAAVPGATHYVVRWKCSINPEQVHDVGDKTSVADVCNDIDMCNGMCAFTVGYIRVQACNDDGCSALVDIPADQAPITCGGGCCC